MELVVHSARLHDLHASVSKHVHYQDWLLNVGLLMRVHKAQGLELLLHNWAIARLEMLDQLLVCERSALLACLLVKQPHLSWLLSHNLYLHPFSFHRDRYVPQPYQGDLNSLTQPLANLLGFFYVKMQYREYR